jgi:hypothetical protein
MRSGCRVVALKLHHCPDDALFDAEVCAACINRDQHVANGWIAPLCIAGRGRITAVMYRAQEPRGLLARRVWPHGEPRLPIISQRMRPAACS